MLVSVGINGAFVPLRTDGPSAAVGSYTALWVVLTADELQGVAVEFEVGNYEAIANRRTESCHVLKQTQ